MADRRYFPMDDLRQLMDVKFLNKSKINCIKHLSSMTGESLRETEDFFEQEWLPFINGTRTPPEKVTELVSESPEFDHLRQQVQDLAREVADLRSMNTRSRAATIFNEED